MHRKLKSLAVVARLKTEEYARKHPNIGDVETLECYCAIGSMILYKLANKAGIPIDLVQGCFSNNSSEYYDDDYVNHCWIEYDGMIYDITATQFSSRFKKIHIVPNYHPNYSAIDYNGSFKDWPDDQSPTSIRNRYKINRLTNS